MCLTITGCQSKEEKEKINKIISELKLEIKNELVITNNENYEIISFKQCKVNKLPISGDEYPYYDINEDVYCFEINIKTTSKEESTLYLLYHDDRNFLSLKDTTYFIDLESHNDLKKYYLIAKNGSNIGVFTNYHKHTWGFETNDPELLYRCAYCNKVEQDYDVATESFIIKKATNDELQEKRDKEEKDFLSLITRLAKSKLKIKGANSYEITDISYNGSHYFLKIQASNGSTGTVKVTYEDEFKDIQIVDCSKYTIDDNGHYIYDLSK